VKSSVITEVPPAPAARSGHVVVTPFRTANAGSSARPQAPGGPWEP
jgi:hypothetical protein